MKTRNRALGAVLGLLLATPSWGQGIQQVRVSIKGMVCAFCATGLKRTFSAEKGVQKVVVSLEEKRLTLEVDANAAPTDERIRELVKDAGYDVGTIDRPTPQATNGTKP
jgi:copper chaperone CopZ